MTLYPVRARTYGHTILDTSHAQIPGCEFVEFCHAQLCRNHCRNHESVLEDVIHCSIVYVCIMYVYLCTYVCVCGCMCAYVGVCVCMSVSLHMFGFLCVHGPIIMPKCSLLIFCCRLPVTAQGSSAI